MVLLAMMETLTPTLISVSVMASLVYAWGKVHRSVKPVPYAYSAV